MSWHKRDDNDDFDNFLSIFFFAIMLWILYAFTPGCTSQQLPPQAPPVVNLPVTPDPISTGYINKNRELITNQAGLDLTKYYEGLYLKAYKDGVGVWTICYGRIDYPSGAKVKEGDTATKQDCERWLLADMDEEGLAYVNKLVKPRFPTLTDNELSALVSFTYNRGPSRLKLLLAESKTKQDLCNNMIHYDYAGTIDHHMLGLQRRRRSERALCLNQDWTQWKDFK